MFFQLCHASVAQSVEHIHGKDGVTGSNPVGGSYVYQLELFRLG